jgi:hypothetical protein
MFNQAYSNILRQLEEMPTFLQKAAASLPREVLVRVPEHDKSPLLEHLWHIRDCDSDLYALRIRRVLREDRPALESVAVGDWPEARAYLARAGDVAVQEFVELRAGLLKDLQDLDQAALSRIGVRVDGSEVNVLSLIEQLAEHDRDHRWRIAAIMRSFGTPA